MQPRQSQVCLSIRLSVYQGYRGFRISKLVIPKNQVWPVLNGLLLSCFFESNCSYKFYNQMVSYPRELMQYVYLPFMFCCPGTSSWVQIYRQRRAFVTIVTFKLLLYLMNKCNMYTQHSCFVAQVEGHGFKSTNTYTCA